MNDLTKRCAIYTRKSHEDGLEQDFNSLDAQREAGENYIASQRANGWVCLANRYDDGGISGGTLERPALKKLIADIREYKIDIVVVYKIDRLSRSLVDFSELQEEFDRYGVSFCAVTQEINTSTSSGRMMLNILMTFAQYEREIITERIRDKVAAAKKRGKHCGGYPVLGYDTDPVQKKLLINAEEAETVKFVFKHYLETGSAREVATQLVLKGHRGKSWTTRRGKVKEGQIVNNQMIYRMLKNPLYIGRVPHKDISYEGEHQAIIDMETWNEVQLLLKSNLTHDSSRRTPKANPFSKLVYCGSCGSAMTLSHTVKKGNRRYSYYICLEDSKRNISICPIKRMPANEFEKLVLAEIGKLFQTPTMFAKINQEEQIITGSKLTEVLQNIHAIWEVMCPAEKVKLLQAVIGKITVFEQRLEINWNVDGLLTLFAEANFPIPGGDVPELQTQVPFKLRHLGQKQTIIMDNNSDAIRFEEPVAKAIMLAHQYAQMLESGKYSTVLQLARALNLDRSYVARTLNLVNLSPEIIKLILSGNAPQSLSLSKLNKGFPTDWQEQKKLLLQ